MPSKIHQDILNEKKGNYINLSRDLDYIVIDDAVEGWKDDIQKSCSSLDADDLKI